MELIGAIILTIFMAAVIVLDVRHYTIPNWLNAALLIFYPIWWIIAPQSPDIFSSLYMFSALLVVGFVLFALRVMGGGDIKLLAICGLYTGWTKVGIEFLFYMGLLGGALSLLLIAARWMVPIAANHLNIKKLPELLTMGAPAPYGVAIAVAFLILLWTDKLPGFVIS